MFREKIGLLIAIGVVVCLLGSLFVAACAPEEVVKAPQPEYKWRLSHQVTPDHPTGIAYQMFADLVEVRTGGRVHIDVFPANILAGAIEAQELLEKGDLELSHVGPFAGIDPRFDIGIIPYTVINEQEVDAIGMDREHGILFQLLNEIFLDHNTKVLTCMDHGFMGMSNSVRPITSVADLKDIKFRTPEMPLYTKFWELAGCISGTLPWAELYTALQLGTFDAQENDPVVTYYHDLYEVQPYYTYSRQLWMPVFLGMSLKLWNEMPKDIQDILWQSADEISYAGRAMNREQTFIALKKMEEAGVEVIYSLSPEATAELMAIAEELWPLAEETVGKDMIDRLRAGLKAYRGK